MASTAVISQMPDWIIFSHWKLPWQISFYLFPYIAFFLHDLLESILSMDGHSPVSLDTYGFCQFILTFNSS